MQIVGHELNGLWSWGTCDLFHEFVPVLALFLGLIKQECVWLEVEDPFIVFVC